MTAFGTDIVDERALARTVEFFRERAIALPTLSELADPQTIPQKTREALSAVGPDEPDARNLFRVHWHNAEDRTALTQIPEHVVLTEELTGVAAPIIVLLGNRFPMIGAHKVLAAYACLVPRLVTGRFDPHDQRAIWPSTGNYCRGGVAISRTLGCRGVAVLPEGMSEERFRWLERWVEQPEDIVRTPGSESNVKEIYDACNELEREPRNVIFNQFREFANHLVHVHCTGSAAARVFEHVQSRQPGWKLNAFVSATGSAGTLGAGDPLKERFHSSVVAVEALECPTMLYNGYGSHNIQGIGDKHIPLIHNVQNTDVAVAVSDASTDGLNVLFNTDAGREWLARERGLSEHTLHQLESFGLSGLCNVLASIKLARARRLGPDDAILTVATDGAALYVSEKEKTLREEFPGGFDARAAAETFASAIGEAGPEDLEELDAVGRDRIFNLGYFTWVEQQGVTLEDFERRRDQAFWLGLRERFAFWDGRIEAFNRETGAVAVS